MAESKRVFNQAKMNRDIDDRLLPAGSYRYGLNINIGESEGGDIGALENLKGNELIAGQDAIQGTTIGSVRDPNNDRVYWFTTSDDHDAVYEYDESTSAVTTILREPKARTAVLPTCAPELISRITEPRGDQPNRPAAPALPTPPVGGCDSPSTTHTSSNGRFFPGTGEFADSSLCVVIPPPPVTTSLSVTVGGAGTFPLADAPVTLTATAANDLGAITYLWSTGETTQTITVGTAGTAEVLTGSVVVTDAGRTAPDNEATSADYRVEFTAAPLVPFSFDVTTSDTIADATSNGAATISGTNVGTAVAVSATSGIAADTGFRFVDASLLTAALTVTGGGAHTLSLSGTGAARTLSGDVFDAGSASIVWSGATTEADASLSCEVLLAGGAPLPASFAPLVPVNAIFRIIPTITSDVQYALSGNGQYTTISGTDSLTANVPFDTPFVVTPTGNLANVTFSHAAFYTPNPPPNSACSGLVRVPVVAVTPVVTSFTCSDYTSVSNTITYTVTIATTGVADGDNVGIGLAYVASIGSADNPSSSISIRVNGGTGSTTVVESGVRFAELPDQFWTVTPTFFRGTANSIVGTPCIVDN